MNKIILLSLAALLLVTPVRAKEDKESSTYTATLIKEAKDFTRVVVAFMVVCNGSYYITGYSPVKEAARYSGRALVGQTKEIATGIILGVGDGLWEIGADTLKYVGVNS